MLLNKLLLDISNRGVRKQSLGICERRFQLFFLVDAEILKGRPRLEYETREG